MLLFGGSTKMVKKVACLMNYARFCHAILVSCDKPINTQVHNIIKRSRIQFQYRVRKCKRAENYIKRNTLLDMCLKGDTDLFEEIKKIWKAPVQVVNCMNRDTGNIVNHFAKKSNDLYNPLMSLMI